MTENAVDLDETTAPTDQPYIPPWLTVGATVALITGQAYAKGRHVQRVTVKTIGKRDIVVTYKTRHGATATERVRHADYVGNKNTLGTPDSYHRWVANGMSGHSLDIMNLDDPHLEEIELESKLDTTTRTVRATMDRWDPESPGTTAQIRLALISHEQAKNAVANYRLRHGTPKPKV